MNPLTKRVITGTTGELLVQLRLFQYGVQAAPPLKDSGNDLIAVRGETFRSVQVRTTGNEDGKWDLPKDRRYHVLALVRLRGHDNDLWLDECEIYLIDRETVEAGGFNLRAPGDEHKISQDLVDHLIPAT